MTIVDIHVLDNHGSECLGGVQNTFHTWHVTDNGAQVLEWVQHNEFLPTADDFGDFHCNRPLKTCSLDEIAVAN